MYGSLTTKELKKKHSYRPVGGVETGSWAVRTCSKAAAGGPGQARWQLEDLGRQGSSWQTGQSYICMWINWEKQLGSKTDHVTQGSSVGK